MLDSLISLLALIPVTQRWLVILVLVAGGTYYETHHIAQASENQIVDTYSFIIQQEALIQEKCNASHS